MGSNILTYHATMCCKLLRIMLPFPLLKKTSQPYSKSMLDYNEIARYKTKTILPPPSSAICVRVFIIHNWNNLELNWPMVITYFQWHIYIKIAIHALNSLLDSMILTMVHVLIFTNFKLPRYLFSEELYIKRTMNH